MIGGRDEMRDIPAHTILIEHTKGLVLLDTGVNPKEAQDPEAHWGRAGGGGHTVERRRTAATSLA